MVGFFTCRQEAAGERLLIPTVPVFPREAGEDADLLQYIFVMKI